MNKLTSMHSLSSFFAAFAMTATLAHAANVRVQVVDQAGAPVPDAIVYALPASGKLPSTKPAGAVIDQIRRRFTSSTTSIRSRRPSASN